MIAITVGFYGYFVSFSIVNVVERQEIEKGLTELNSKVLALESEYVKAKNLVTVDQAKSDGFVAVNSPKFVNLDDRNTSGLSLNLR